MLMFRYLARTITRQHQRAAPHQAVALSTTSSTSSTSSTSFTSSTPSSLEQFKTEAEHQDFLEANAQLPDGFSTATRTFSFSPRELPTLDAAMTLTMLSLDDPNGTAAWAAMFTKNAFPGSPVVVGREMLESSCSRVRGIIANNKISNVFPGGDEGSSSGVNNAKRVAQAALEALNPPSASPSAQHNKDVHFLPSSTGVIGWRIPADEMIAEMPALVSSLQSDSALPAARGIMTTDLYPKLRGVDIQCDNGKTGRLVGIAKGAGMIEPNM